MTCFEQTKKYLTAQRPAHAIDFSTWKMLYNIFHANEKDVITCHKKIRWAPCPLRGCWSPCPASSRLHAGPGAVQHRGQRLCIRLINQAALTAVSMAFPIQNLLIAVSAGTCVGVQCPSVPLLGKGMPKCQPGRCQWTVPGLCKLSVLLPCLGFSGAF